MLKYEKFRKALRQVIQSSELDVGVVYFILKDMLYEIEALYLGRIQQEAQSEAQAQSENKEEQSE